MWLAYPGAAPSRPCLIWQNGQTGGIDTDVFMGSDADWAEFLGQASPPSPLPAPSAPSPAPPTTEENEMQDSTTIYHRQNGAEYGEIAGKWIHLDPGTAASLQVAPANRSIVDITDADVGRLRAATS